MNFIADFCIIFQNPLINKIIVNKVNCLCFRFFATPETAKSWYISVVLANNPEKVLPVTGQKHH
jgi:hypothetical protein